MMRHISSFSCIILFVCLSLVGLALLPFLPVKLSPSRELPSISVNFSSPGNSPEVVEREITSRIEAQLARIRGVKNISSASSEGYGNITVEFDRFTDIGNAQFEATVMLRHLWREMPTDVSYPEVVANRSDERSSRPFMTYTVNSSASPYEIQRYVEQAISNRLAIVEGVKQVKVSGATPLEWVLTYDADKLDQCGVGVTDIKEAIAQHYKSEYIGLGRTSNALGEERWIRLALADTQSKDSIDLARIFVMSADSVPLRLDRLVTAIQAEQRPDSHFRINGLNSIYITIKAEDYANQLKLSNEIKNLVSEIETSLLSDYEVHLLYDASEYINKELSTILIRTAATFAILLLFILVYSRNWRYLLIVASSLVVNILVAFIFYYLFHLEIQLYSLAGITISINLIIDNVIVMADHFVHRRNLKAFTAILAATLTTIGSLSVIFLLDEKLRLNLQDFAAVVIVNLLISLAVALFFVPAMIDKLSLSNSSSDIITARISRKAVIGSQIYARFVSLILRFRVAVLLLLLMAMGLSLWIFVKKVYNGNYPEHNEETVLVVAASLPNGSTLDQMDELMIRMEDFLSKYKQIRQFQTNIWSANQAQIEIYFTRDNENSHFPFLLKNDIIGKALQLGGGSWGVYGLPDQGFSNDVRESAGNYQVKLYGYNYDELYQWADSLKHRLLQHQRIREVNINSEFSFWKPDYSQYVVDVDRERLAQAGLDIYQLYTSLGAYLGKDEIVSVKDGESIKLSAKQSGEYDMWSVVNMPFAINGKHYKMGDFISISKQQTPQSIVKENQQYRLCLQYEYLGSTMQGQRVLKEEVLSFSKILPMGYNVKIDDLSYDNGQDQWKQYFLLGVVVVIIFFISAILFNSLSQPIAILCVIPISFIGVFLIFYSLDLNFNQGGFASMILLSGITVNASIYILCEYNDIMRSHPKWSQLKIYNKAFNRRIVPITLTVTSTILGFVPFLIGEKENFWFPLAIGTIGGMVMSIVGIFVYLPILKIQKIRKDRERTPSHNNMFLNRS